MHIAVNIYLVKICLNHFNVKILRVSEDNSDEVSKYKNLCIMLKIFPIILIICWIFGTINRTYFYVADDENISLTIIHVLAWKLQGLLNALAYSYYYLDVVRKMCSKAAVAEERKVEIGEINEVTKS